MRRLALLLCLALAAPALPQATPSLSAPSPARDSIPLREYVDIRFSAQDKAIQAALDSLALAVAKAEAATEKRFEGVNEFRSTLNDNTRTLMPRAEAELGFKAIEQKIEGITGRIDILAARVNARDDQSKGAGNLWGYLIGAIGAVLGLMAFLGKPLVSRSRK